MYVPSLNGGSPFIFSMRFHRETVTPEVLSQNRREKEVGYIRKPAKNELYLLTTGRTFCSSDFLSSRAFYGLLRRVKSLVHYVYCFRQYFT